MEAFTDLASLILEALPGKAKLLRVDTSSVEFRWNGQIYCIPVRGGWEFPCERVDNGKETHTPECELIERILQLRKVLDIHRDLLPKGNMNLTKQQIRDRVFQLLPGVKFISTTEPNAIRFKYEGSTYRVGSNLFCEQVVPGGLLYKGEQAEKISTLLSSLE
jgi:hypothetical protein